MNENRFTYEFFFEKFSLLSKLDGSIKAENYGSSGLYSTNQLYKDFNNILSEKIYDNVQGWVYIQLALKLEISLFAAECKQSN